MGIFGKSPEPKAPDPGSPPRTASAAPATPAVTPSPVRAACVIGAKTTVKGEISGDEDVLVDGTVEGQIRLSRDLKVGAGGVVRATIEAQSIQVSGEVVGDCIAVSRVEIQATGRVNGNIRAPKIVIAEGAVFRGRSDMSGRREKAESKEKPERPEKTVPSPS